MNIYDKLMNAFDNMNADAVMEFYHSDYAFVRHQTDTVLTLSEWAPMMKDMIESGKMKIISSKCCYENEEVLVIHNVLSFPDGSKEAVLACHKKKDGKIFHTETGATPLK